MSPERRRVRVTSPQTRLALARGHRPPHGLLVPGSPGAPDDGIGDPAERALAEEVFRRQRRLAVRTMVLLGTLLFGLSGLLALWPAPDPTRIAGIPASWLLLMTASYPLLLLSAVIHVRRAERIERVGSPGSPRPGPGPGEPGDTRESSGPPGSRVPGPGAVPGGRSDPRPRPASDPSSDTLSDPVPGGGERP
ncbi:hypothetical protein [Streptomyces sp. ST2-7A]|uniref:hypothetical protein n=1 Tax=Streptomyces sp. ST2-7A TaxID=2907214 RepID=UPI001F30CA7C|nr:hypothetical protein [Streptomyces sp. ST2-7A]MCE7078807.1 hypothetical protein [Streptomyces sp. ST2-7A]